MKAFFVLLCLSSLFLNACQTIDLPEEEVVVRTRKQKVSVEVRSMTNEPLLYPLVIYAFDTSGKMRGTQTIAGNQDKMTLSLPAGVYRLVALGGQEAYSWKSVEVTLASSLSPPNGVVTTRPLMRGEASVEVGTKKAHVNMTMHYAVASVDLALKNIPEKVTAVSLRLEQLYGAMSLAGSYARPTAVTIACQRAADGVWRLPHSYVFPAAEASSLLSIALTEPELTRNYSFTLSSGIKAATPYHLTGNYTPGNEISISGDILSAGWQPAVNHEFTFGATDPITIVPGGGAPTPGGDGTGGGSGGTNGGTTTVPPTTTITGLPAPGSIWQGKHIVGLLENVTEQGADLLLISLQKWDGLPSANHEGASTFVTDIATQYVEQGVSNWTIPTKEEAKALAKAYNGASLEKLNATIKQLGGTEIYDQIERGYEKYLCADARSTFSFKANTSIGTAGKTAYNYYLLLVKRVHVARQQ